MDTTAPPEATSDGRSDFSTLLLTVLTEGHIGCWLLAIGRWLLVVGFLTEEHKKHKFFWINKLRITRIFLVNRLHEMTLFSFSHTEGTDFTDARIVLLACASG